MNLTLGGKPTIVEDHVNEKENKNFLMKWCFVNPKSVPLGTVSYGGLINMI